jgi:two-component system phosphate regulon response regulator PhoB
VDVQIVGLRKKLGEAGEYIETVRGIGYRFKDME